MEFERQNPHWEDGFFYPFPLKRFLYYQIIKYFDKPLIFAIFGMRRVGKTVLMKQLINHLIQHGVKRQNILYFSFDDFSINFWDVIREWERRIGSRVSQQHYLFLDEIQKLSNWQEKIKLLYDTSGAKIVVTGSASALLKKGSESLAGRVIEFIMPPLSFHEYLLFRGEEVSQLLEEKIERLYLHYLKHQLPAIVNEEEDYTQTYLQSLIEKIIYWDIPQLYGATDIEKLAALVNLIRKQPGFLLDYNALSSDIGISRITLSRYVKYLEDAFLIRRIFNYSHNPFTSEKRLKKVYPYAPCFSLGEMPEMIETAVAFELDAKFFYRDKQKREIDFIVPKLAAVEVKYRQNVRSKDLQYLVSFSTQENLQPIVITKKDHGTRTIAGQKVVSLPYYLLPFSPYTAHPSLDRMLGKHANRN